MEINHKESQDLIQLVSFNLGNEEFGIDILKVQEIIRLINITKILNSPVFIEGVINLCGRVIPVIDLRIKLGIPKTEHYNTTRIIVMEIKNINTGFIVDGVSEVYEFPQVSLNRHRQWLQALKVILLLLLQNVKTS